MVGKFLVTWVVEQGLRRQMDLPFEGRFFAKFSHIKIQRGFAEVKRNIMLPVLLRGAE